MRVALAICVVLGSALCGRAAADAVRRRSRTLDGLSRGLRVLRIHMIGMMEPVQFALERSDCPLFSQVCGGMRRGVSAGAAWKEVRGTACRRGGAADALSQADLAVLDRLFGHLGESGVEEQGALLDAVLRELEALGDQARKRAGEAEKLYGSLGLLLGLMLAIIVI